MPPGSTLYVGKRFPLVQKPNWCLKACSGMVEWMLSGCLLKQKHVGGGSLCDGNISSATWCPLDVCNPCQVCAWSSCKISILFSAFEPHSRQRCPWTVLPLSYRANLKGNLSFQSLNCYLICTRPASCTMRPRVVWGKDVVLSVSGATASRSCLS